MSKVFSTIRSRLILIIILTSLPGLIFLYQTGLNQRKQAIAAAEAEVVHLGRVASKMQVGMVDNVKAFLLTVAHMPSVRNNEMSDCQEFFTHMVSDHFKYYSSFYVADMEGNILCSPPGGHDAPDFDGCDHYKNLTRANDFVYSGYHICKRTGKSVLSIGYPITNLEGKIASVTNVSLDLIWFYDFAKDASLLEGAELILISEDGTILSHYPDNDQWRGLWLPAGTALAELYEAKQGSVIGKGLNGEEGVYAISGMDGTTNNLYMILGLPTRLAFESANRTMRNNLILLISIMTVVIILMWILGDAIIVKQAQKLVQVAKRLATGDLTTRTEIDYRSGELGEVAQAFDSMAGQLEAREEERQRSEAELKAYSRDLERSNQELRDFTFIASHDLREPLRKIQTFGDLLKDRYVDDLDERGANYVTRMQNAAQRMQLLLEKLLSFSRVTTNAQPFVLVDMNQVTRQVLGDFDLQIENSRAIVEVGDLPVLEADPTQMSHLMLNLISNALKFHPAAEPPVVRISSRRLEVDGEERVEIRVEDQGIGIEEKYTEKVFQPFQRLHARDVYEGTGMGLTICKKIVERHGGTIRIESEPGKGATFIVQLPLKQEPSERPGEA